MIRPHVQQAIAATRTAMARLRASVAEAEPERTVTPIFRSVRTGMKPGGQKTPHAQSAWDRDTDKLLRDLTHLPIWPSARRPSWWHHLDVREFLTVAHRQMSLIEAERMGKEHFGDRCPGKSAIHVYWQRLDLTKTGAALTPRPSAKTEDAA